MYTLSMYEEDLKKRMLDEYGDEILIEITFSQKKVAEKVARALRKNSYKVSRKYNTIFIKEFGKDNAMNTAKKCMLIANTLGQVSFKNLSSSSS